MFASIRFPSFKIITVVALKLAVALEYIINEVLDSENCVFCYQTSTNLSEKQNSVGDKQIIVNIFFTPNKKLPKISAYIFSTPPQDGTIKPINYQKFIF